MIKKKIINIKIRLKFNIKKIDKKTHFKVLKYYYSKIN